MQKLPLAAGPRYPGRGTPSYRARALGMPTGMVVAPTHPANVGSEAEERARS